MYFCVFKDEIQSLKPEITPALVEYWFSSNSAGWRPVDRESALCKCTGVQLRVHCHHLGHTIVGDYTYSSRRDLLPPRMFLHAARLVLDTRLERLDISTGDPFTPVLPATVSRHCHCSVAGRRARPRTGRWRRRCAACSRGWRCARTRPPAGLSCSPTSDQLSPPISQDRRRKIGR